MSASFCRQFVPAQEAHLSFTKTRLCKQFFPFILFTAPKVVTFNLSGNKYYKKPLVYSFYAFSPHTIRPVKKALRKCFRHFSHGFETFQTAHVAIQSKASQNLLAFRVLQQPLSDNVRGGVQAPRQRRCDDATTALSGRVRPRRKFHSIYTFRRLR